ncbi:hypothetical protein TWF481_006682 [Arthrobotrys musiformis]|uniref:Azaphilone pigments biosynthesis cluster protein L N-terminal domain-containing protein n=1 Tax=Arthrobotrys musiformis TaxID=47236 RepID=A0AAV9W990_9PEZI
MSGLEGLSTAANVIGVVVFGLQAAKFIAESVSKYQDAEDDCKRFQAAILRLAGVLGDVNDIIKTDEDKLRYSSLYKVTKTCTDELVKMQKNISEWTGSGPKKNSKTIQTWKKFKAIFLGDNIKRWLESLESHYGFINFQLNRIQLDDRKDQKAATERIETVLGNVSATVSVISDAQVETLARIDKAETSVTRQLQANLVEVQNINTSVGVSLNQFNGQLSSIDSSVKQFTTTQIHRTLEERQQDEFEKATGRIFQLGTAAATRRELGVQQEQTEQVLEDFRKVLEFARDGTFSGVSGWAVDFENPRQRNRKISAFLASLDSLSIGYDTKAFRSFRTQSQKSSCSVTNSYQWEHQEFSLRVMEELKYGIPRTKAKSQPGDFIKRVMKITYLPKSTGISSAFDLYLTESRIPDDITNALNTPIYAGLCFRATIPNESPIFDAIFCGRFEEFKNLISVQQASIHDCDTSGQSLLTCALMPIETTHPGGCPELEGQSIMQNRYSIAQFLIDSGIDVNHVDNYNCDPVSRIRALNNKRGVEILFENGANPMLNPRNIMYYARELNPAEWKRLLGWILEFYDINDDVAWTIDAGTRKVSLLHSVLWYYTVGIWRGYSLSCHYDIKEVVRMLISNGADAHGRTVEGETCLHLVVQATRDLDCVPADGARTLLRELLLFLIEEIKLDIRAQTTESLSVSDLVFYNKCPAGRCIWPVWVSVLLELGYDPLDVAKGSYRFDKIEGLYTSMVDGLCTYSCCYFANFGSEDEYVEVSEKSLEDGYSEEGLEDGFSVYNNLVPNRGLDDGPAYSFSISDHTLGAQSCPEPSNILDDYEFFENLAALSNGEGLTSEPGYKASVSNWARVFELDDWDCIEG